MLSCTILTRISGVFTFWIWIKEFSVCHLSLESLMGTARRVLRSGTIQRTSGPGTLRLVEYLTEVGPDGTVLLGRRSEKRGKLTGYAN